MSRTLVIKNLDPITLTDEPQPLSETSLKVSEFTLEGPTENSGSFFIGDETISTTKGITRVKAVPLNISSIDIDGQPKHYDLSKIYVVGTAGDIVRVEYVAYE